MSFCADDLVDVYIQKRVCGKAAFEKGTFVQDCYFEVNLQVNLFKHE